MINVNGVSTGQAADIVVNKETGAYQQEAAEVCKQAVALMDGKDFQGAYKLLLADYNHYATDNDANFLLGQCAYQLKDPRAAIQYYQNILAKDPSLPRVRLELGKAYVASGQTNEARKEFNWVLTTSPPPTVADHVRQFIALLDAQKKVNIKASVGYRYDSNVNAGLDDLTHYSGWNLGKKSDSAAVVGINVDVIHDSPSGDMWQTSLGYNGTKYVNEKDFSSDEWALYTGVVRNMGTKMLYVPMAVRKTDIGSENYSTSIGLAPQLQVKLSPERLLFVAVSGMSQKYHTVPERDGNQWAFNIAERVNHSKVPGAFFEFGLGYIKETAKNVSYASDSYSARLTYYTPIGKGFNLMVQPGFIWRNYEGPDPLSNFFGHSAVRKDVTPILQVNLSKAIESWNYSLTYTYSKNNSNLDPCNYNRTLINLQVSKNL